MSEAVLLGHKVDTTLISNPRVRKAAERAQQMVTACWFKDDHTDHNDRYSKYYDHTDYTDYSDYSNCCSHGG